MVQDNKNISSAVDSTIDSSYGNRRSQLHLDNHHQGFESQCLIEEEKNPESAKTVR